MDFPSMLSAQNGPLPQSALCIPRLRVRALGLALLAALLFVPTNVAAMAETWVPVGELGGARADHTATLLQDGRVLVVGGFRRGSSLSSAELYDPTTGLWAPTGVLGTARVGHTATLLADGRVLVSGGSGDSFAFLASTEIYDPTTGTWTATGGLGTERVGHTATLLLDGRVLLAGGFGGSRETSVEMYDPTTRVWTATGDLSIGRTDHTATLLVDGRVLVAGGSGVGGVFASAEVYDPVTGTWTATGNLTSARGNHTATLLSDGRVLLAGGLRSSGLTSGIEEVEVYDPATGTWTTTGNLTTGRYSQTATMLPDGRVLVAGGIVDIDRTTSVEVYDPATGAWTATGSLSTARASHTATLLPDGRLLVVAGEDGVGEAIASAEVYQAAIGVWTATGSLNTARSGHTATLLPDGRVLVAGGGDSVLIGVAEVYQPAIGEWTETGSLNTARGAHTATLLSDGRVLVAGGSASSGLTASAELYDPATSTWTASGNLSSGRALHTATLLTDGRVLVAGGLETSDGARFAPADSVQVYDPMTGMWVATGSLNTARESHTATLLRDGRVLVAGGFDSTATTASAEVYDPTNGSWTSAGNLMTARASHTATLLADGRVLLAGGADSRFLSTASAEVYNPTSGTWTETGELGSGRREHTATLLRDGRVLRLGTLTILPGAEVYDPAIGTWMPTADLTTERVSYAATLLPDGRVLVSGGQALGTGIIASAEVYDRGLGFDPARQPIITSAPTVVPPGGAITLAGTGFRGVSEASDSNAQNSPTNYPLVQLRRLDNGAAQFLDVDPAIGWSDTEFTSLPITGVSPGPALVTVFTNGIPSASIYVLLDGDRDNDGVGDTVDVFPRDPAETTDTDDDGTGNNADLDDDGDTLPDIYETDNRLDALDAADALVDSDGDGFSNVEEFQSGTLAGDAASAPVMDSGVILFSAVLPASRSVSVGSAAIAFATIINAGTAAAVGCKLSFAGAVTGDFSFATTNPLTNAVEGLLNYPAASIAPNATQSYVLSITPTAAFAPTDMALEFSCTNAQAAPLTVGLNTLLLSASDTPVPDILVSAATAPTNNGIVTLPGPAGIAAFSLATINLGESGDITVTADTGTANLPVRLSLCGTNPMTGTCINPRAPTFGPVTTAFGTNETATFSVFLIGAGDVPFDPANSRVLVRFKDASGVTRGATSVAVRTQ